MDKRVIITVVASVATALQASAEERQLAETGRLLADQHCAACHATGPRETSPHRDAPAFVQLAAKWPLNRFEDAFTDGIITGHPDMPLLLMEEGQIEAFIAYLFTLTPEGRRD